MSWLADLWDDWKFAVGWVVSALAIGALIILISNAITSSTTADFTRDCLRDHPGSHVDVVSNTGRGWSNTRYCLGPDGELWRVD